MKSPLLFSVVFLLGMGVHAACLPESFVVSEPKFRQTLPDVVSFTGTVTNKGASACGVQLKIVTFDAAGAPLEAKEFWPASVRNIAPGGSEHYTYFVQFDSAMKTFDLRAVSAKAW